MDYTILIPFHSNKNILFNCLSSILSTTPTNVKIIVLANNSNKNELDITYDHKRVTIQKFNFDSSYPAIMNLGIEYVNTEGIIFCDADTFMEKGWYEKLTFVLESNQNIGLVGANILNMNLGTVSDFGLVFDGYSWVHPYKNLPFNHKLIKTQDFQAICSACCAVRKDTFIKIGKYDEKLRYTYCDIDLSLRMKKYGYRVVGCAGALVYHLGQSTQKNASILKLDNKTRLTLNNASIIQANIEQYYQNSFKNFKYDIETNYI
ncbi:MAG: glycosyltransferase, partial [Anaeroplasmataceae bacterium]|nr:glycosyltransferase [Anaeroplasmataceae bacterium]